MINIETLLSSFDERGTLLKWLKAVEKALNEATLTNVDVITISSTQIKLKFNFEDGTSIETSTITLPKGEQGEPGEQGEQGEPGEPGATGVGISNVTIDANNHLIVTLTDETEIDAGEIDVTSGVVVDSAISNTSENPVQNKVIYTALAGKQDVIDATHKLSADNVDDSATTNKFVTSAEKSTWNGKQDVIDASHKLSADNVDDSATTNKFVTSAEKSTWNGKQNALTTSSVDDGTIDKTIGFDNQGNIVKGSAGGGGGAVGGGYNLIFTSSFPAGNIYVFGGKLTTQREGQPVTEDWFGLHKFKNIGVGFTCENAVYFYVDVTTNDFGFNSGYNNCHDATGTQPTSMVAYKPYFLSGETRFYYED